MEQQFKRANADRVEIVKQLKRENRRRKKAKDPKKKKKSKKHRKGGSSSGSDSSSSSGSSAESAINVIGNDSHDFRRLGREHPGVTYASVVADMRSQLGQRGFDHDVGANGPVFWKFHESVFPTKANGERLSALRKSGELLMLTAALDEIRQGRVMEVADILASRYKAITYWGEKGNWAVAREYLTYCEQSHSLVSDATEDAAVRLVEQRRRRESKAQKRDR